MGLSIANRKMRDISALKKTGAGRSVGRRRRTGTVSEGIPQEAPASGWRVSVGREHRRKNLQVRHWKRNSRPPVFFAMETTGMAKGHVTNSTRNV